MKKILLSALLITTSITASAVPNFWNYGYVNMGYSEAYIVNTKKQSLAIDCYNDERDSEHDHGVSFESGKKDYWSGDDNTSISFLLDGKKVVYAPSSTLTRSGSNTWNEFVKGIAKARKIEVYVNDRKKAIFRPKKASIKQVADLPKECSASF